MEGYKQTLKLLMTTDTVGGVWTYSMELCQTLLAHNVEVHLVTMGAKMADHQRKEASALSNIELYETDFLLEWMQNPWEDIRECGEWLLQLEEAVNPDVIHLNSYSFGSLPFTAPKIVVAHSDVYSWFQAVTNDDPPAYWKQYFWNVKQGLDNADLVVAPSHAVMDSIKRIYSLRSKRHVIYNGRNAASFCKRQKEPFVFSMGRLWDEAKNIKLLTAAAPMVHAPIKIAGDDTFEQNYFEAQKNVSFMGKLTGEEVAFQLSKASIYALPAMYEPFGLSALEAALSGCALVLGDIASLREIWQDDALYVGTNDTDALASTLNDLLNDKEKLQFYQGKALNRAKLFTSEAMCQEYLNVYHHLLSHEKERLKQELI